MHHDKHFLAAVRKAKILAGKVGRNLLVVWDPEPLHVSPYFPYSIVWDWPQDERDHILFSTSGQFPA